MSQMKFSDEGGFLNRHVLRRDKAGFIRINLR
jgi:hypothetical protein